MGHIINPVSYRIGYSQFWNSTWSISNASQKLSYNFLSTENLLLVAYLKQFFLKTSRRLFGRGVLMINFKLFRVNNQTTLFIDTQVKQLFFIFKLIAATIFSAIGIKQLKKKSKGLGLLKKVRKGFKLQSSTLKNKIKSKFIRRVSKMTKYVSTIAEPDLLAYHWNSIVSLFRMPPVFREIKWLRKHRRLVILKFLQYLLFKRWVITLKRNITTSLRNFYLFKQPINLILAAAPATVITANFIAKYLATRLIQRFPLRKLLNTVFKQLQAAQAAGHIHGFKISCNGRFERRGRATHTWKVVGALPIRDININVDYAIMLPVLTNSICAIKVWITRALDTEKLLII